MTDKRRQMTDDRCDLLCQAGRFFGARHVERLEQIRLVAAQELVAQEQQSNEGLLLL